MENNLTCEAKDAIRAYVLKIILPPGIIITILVFLAGFFLNDVAKQKAYNEAYKAASDKILDLTAKASDAASDAESAKIIIEQEINQIRKKSYDADKIIDTLKIRGEYDNLNKNITNITNAIAKRISEDKKIIKDISKHIEEIQETALGDLGSFDVTFHGSTERTGREIFKFRGRPFSIKPLVFTSQNNGGLHPVIISISNIDMKGFDWKVSSVSEMDNTFKTTIIYFAIENYQ